MDQEKDTTEQQAAANTPPLTDQQKMIDAITPEIIEEFKTDLENINTKYKGKIPFILLCQSYVGRKEHENGDEIITLNTKSISGVDVLDLSDFIDLTKREMLKTIIGE